MNSVRMETAIGNMSDARKKVRWLNNRAALGRRTKWAVGDDVFCRHCDGFFKAEDVVCDDEGGPTCPVCRGSTPLDFARLPWWRIDLVEEKRVNNRTIYAWRAKPLRATPNKPRLLPFPS
jgi:hypothetical protein